MKKISLFAAMLLCALTISARPYQHSVGVNVGGINGASYKGFVRSLEHMFIIADLGVKVSASKGMSCTEIDHIEMGGQSSTETSSWSQSSHFVYYSFEANPNLGYQGDIKDFDFASLHWYAGGGVSVGLSQLGGNWGEIADARKYADKPFDFKLGINAIAGVEMCLKNAPLNIGVDFRPGMATNMHFHSESYGAMSATQFMSATYFDWALAASLRYRF